MVSVLGYACYTTIVCVCQALIFSTCGHETFAASYRGNAVTLTLSLRTSAHAGVAIRMILHRERILAGDPADYYSLRGAPPSLVPASIAGRF